MAEAKVLKRGSASADDESMAMLYEGANMGQLAVLFKLDHRTLQKKLFEGNCKPVGKRGSAEIYSIHEVAPYLVKPVFDVETYIKKMDPRELPKILTKEFWAGLRSKQEYEARAGLLWPTEKVVEEVGELMKLVKMSTLLMQDAVERQTELTDRQRSIMQGLSRGMLADLMARIEKRFKVPDDGELQEEADDEEL